MFHLSRLKRNTLLTFILVILIVSAGCGNASGSKKSDTIVYGGSSWIGHLPAYIANKKGFFKEEGLNVKYQSFPTSSERMTALSSGEVDFASTGAISVISLMAAGDKNFTIVGAPDMALEQEGIVANTNVKSVKDLKGKKVAVTFSSSSHVVLFDILQNNGLDPHKDVQVINMAGPDIVSAFTNGEIDAAAIWTPYLQKIQAVDGAHTLAMDTDTTINKKYGFPCGPDTLVFRTDFMENDEETTQKLLSAYYKASKWITDHPEEASELFSELTNADVKEQAQIISSIHWLNDADQADLLNNSGDFTQTLDYLSKFLNDNGLIKKSVDVKEWINADVTSK